MKKTYISPEATTIVLDCQSIIADSENLGGKTNGSVTNDGTTNGDGTNENQFSGSYRTSIWGD